MVNVLSRQCAEEQFKSASAEAALFRVACATPRRNDPYGTQPTIDTKLSIVLGAIRAHFQSTLKADEDNLLTKALAVRNKLLHCEFSTAHEHLNQSSFAVCLRQVPVREDQVPPAAAPSRAAITAFGEHAAAGRRLAGGSHTAEQNVFEVMTLQQSYDYPTAILPQKPT
jgi:hypothetical protein